MVNVEHLLLSVWRGVSTNKGRFCNVLSIHEGGIHPPPPPRHRRPEVKCSTSKALMFQSVQPNNAKETTIEGAQFKHGSISLH